MPASTFSQCDMLIERGEEERRGGLCAKHLCPTASQHHSQAFSSQASTQASLGHGVPAWNSKPASQVSTALLPDGATEAGLEACKLQAREQPCTASRTCTDVCIWATMAGGVVQTQADGGGPVQLSSQLELSPEDPGKRSGGEAAVAEDAPAGKPEQHRKQGLLGLFRKYEKQSCEVVQL